MLPTTNSLLSIIREELSANNIKIFAIFNNEINNYRRIKVVLAGTPYDNDIVSVIDNINCKLIKTGFDADAVYGIDGRFRYIVANAQI